MFLSLYLSDVITVLLMDRKLIILLLLAHAQSRLAVFITGAGAGAEFKDSSILYFGLLCFAENDGWLLLMHASKCYFVNVI